MGWAKRTKNLERALERAAKKMMTMALRLEQLGEGWVEPAVQMRAEAALAFSALHEDEEQ